jgi:DNA-binding PadR family transcriptional regulator
MANMPFAPRCGQRACELDRQPFGPHRVSAKQTHTHDRIRVMTRKASLGEFEQLLLLAVLRLRDEAFGSRIGTELEEKAGRRVSRGALYSSLDRLEGKGFLEWEVEPPTAERGGHPARCFALTPAGLGALREHQRAYRRLAAGLEEVLEEGAAG